MAVPELPSEYTIHYYRGTYFEFGGRIATKDPDTGLKTYWNLTGYTGKMQVKRNESDTAPLVFEPTWDAAADLANGYFRFYRTDEDMIADADIIATAKDAPYFYDVFLTPSSGQPKCWLKGQFRIYQNVTVL